MTSWTKSSVWSWGPLAASRQINLEVVPVDTPLVVQADPSRLGLALGNLVDNAVKFTPQVGRVTLGAERLDQKIRLWVADEGPGVEPDELPKIFDRFIRGKKALETGAGLGLAIVKSVVEAHGGEIGVETLLDGGSRFSIILK